MSTANSISDSPPPSLASHSGGPDMNPLASVLSLLALIAIPTLIYAFFFTINCPPNPFRRNSSRNAGDLRTKSGKQMDLVSIVKYMKQEHGGDCPVCLSAFVDGEEVRQLSVCNHSFHIACIDMWLSSHSSCPVCRAAVAVKRHKKQPVDGEDDLRQGLPDSATLV